MVDSKIEQTRNAEQAYDVGQSQASIGPASIPGGFSELHRQLGQLHAATAGIAASDAPKLIPHGSNPIRGLAVAIAMSLPVWAGLAWLMF
jgi:hypothetical protein